MTANSEFNRKHARAVAWLHERDADVALLATPANVSWLGCGGELTRHDATLAFVLMPERTLLLCPRDDADRIRQEEVRGLGIEIVSRAGFESSELVQHARDLVPNSSRWISDTAGLGFEIDSGLDDARRTLEPEEIERLRKLGRDAAVALEEVAAECFRGIVERDAAARLAAECVRRQITPRALFAGADERLEAYPRPFPKGGCAEHALMLGLVGSRGGLHVALSRIVCLVRPDATMTERFGRSAAIVAQLRHEARIGQRLGDVVQKAVPNAADLSTPLGGLIGYAFPEVEARASSNWKIGAAQAFVWTVGPAGARCEDTDLIGVGGSEVLTRSEDWPRRSFEIDGRLYEVPDLMQL